jgi:ABC-type antimicrobial peptide transport system permease subunit
MTAQPAFPSGFWKFLRFAVLHSLRDMWRSRSRTFFALLCVATGVAAIVALRSLGFMIGDQLDTNLAQVNRGDIRLTASTDVPELIQLSSQNNPVFTQQTVDLVHTWAKGQGVDVTVGRMSMFAPITSVVNGQEQASQPGRILFIEPNQYPLYDKITLSDPAGTTLNNLFAQYASGTAAEPLPIVISNRLAQRSNMGLHVGSTLRIGASNTVYIVRGIAPTNAETLLTNPAAAFLGDYVYLPMADLANMGEAVLPDQIFLKVPVGRDITAVDQSLVTYLQTHTQAKTNLDRNLSRTTVPQLKKQNSNIANVIDKMILVMGLSALLIGGIGIINTMLVVVSRRTLEIAVLKTLGLKAYRVTLLFLIEALLLGLVGSLLGVGLGIILSYLVRGVGEKALTLTLTWRLYPTAMLSGLFLGIVITGLFGFLPTLIAGQIRPAVVLRPNEAQMPAAGLLQTLVTLVVMIVILGLLISSIVSGSINYGPVIMLAGAGALVGLFGGVIVANTRLGKPIPADYVFRLPRRFEQLENRLTGAVGALTGGRSPDRRERGRAAITRGLRIIRQAVLLYGSLAVGLALASAIILIVSEVWLPFGIGHAKPANDLIHAWQRSQWGWEAFGLLLTLALGLLIRRRARTFGGVIALGSLGISLGGALGLAGGYALRAAVGSGAVWHFLAGISTGIVLVEGALALLSAVFLGYWLLVWSVSKMPTTLLMGIISLTLLGIILGLAAGVALLGRAALIALIVVAILTWLGVRFRVWRRLPGQQAAGALPPNSHANDISEIAQMTARGGSMVMLGAAAFAGIFLLAGLSGTLARWIGLAVGVVMVVGLWRFLQRGYRVDGRLVLREMGGRRNRVASTLLGLSVGLAALSLVALTTTAASHLLKVQLTSSIEGNLLIYDPTSQHGQDVLNVLRSTQGVKSFSQVTTYRPTVTAINGTAVERRRPLSQNNQSSTDNSTAGSTPAPSGRGLEMGLTERLSLANLPDYTMKAGRSFTPQDAGQNVILLRESDLTNQFNIVPGDVLTLVFANNPGTADDVTLQVRVIGVISRQSKQTGLEQVGNLSVLPPGVLPATVKPMGIATIANIDQSNPVYMDRAMVALSGVPNVIAFQLSSITQLANNLINQLKAIPTLVAWLALVAGAAIIANTVALATQERRRQIGVMKAVGVKGRRVLGMLIIENGLVGLTAGLIGVAAGFLVTVILVLSTPTPAQLKSSIAFGTMGWLLLMAIGIAVSAATLSAWSAAAEKPMNVLRYE